MGLWISANIGTIVVSIILIAVVSLIILKMIRDKKAGKTSCGGGCSSCAMGSFCHKGNENDGKDEE